MKNSVLIHKKHTISVDKQPEHSWVREEKTVYSDIHVSLRTRSRSLVFHIHCQTASRQCWSEGISSMSWISMTPLRRNNSLSFPFSENIKVYLSISDIKIQCLNDSFECALSSAFTEAASTSSPMNTQRILYWQYIFFTSFQHSI